MFLLLMWYWSVFSLHQYLQGELNYTLLFPLIKETINSKMKMKNKTLAMLAAPAAIPPNPKTPAIIANIIKVTVQRNIVICF